MTEYPERKGCCADRRKPCSFHEGWMEGYDNAEATRPAPVYGIADALSKLRAQNATQYNLTPLAYVDVELITQLCEQNKRLRAVAKDARDLLHHIHAFEGVTHCPGCELESQIDCILGDLEETE